MLFAAADSFSCKFTNIQRTKTGFIGNKVLFVLLRFYFFSLRLFFRNSVHDYRSLLYLQQKKETVEYVTTKVVIEF